MPRGRAVVLLLSFILCVKAVYRQHHAAILVNPSTVLLIGGAAAPNNYSQFLDLRKQQTKPAYSSFPVTYHTAAQTLTNDTLVLFGTTDRQTDNLSAPLWYTGNNATLLNTGNATVPPLRYGHSSISNNDTIYVAGGMSSDENVLNDIWQWSLTNMSWTVVTDNAATVAGHCSVMYNNWIVSCFGFDSDPTSPLGKCSVFDVHASAMVHVSYQSSHRPRPRVWASLTLPSNSSQAILYGGQDNSGNLLNDLWTLDLSGLPNSLDWQHIPANNTTVPSPTPRCGHVALQVLPQLNASDAVLMIHGGEGPNRFYNDSSAQYLDVNTLTWISPSMVSQRFNNGGIMMSDIAGNTTVVIQQYDDSTSGSSHRLSGGAIGGIVVGVLGCIAGAFGLFVWRRRRSYTSHIAAASDYAKPSEPSPPSDGGVVLQPLHRTLSEKEDLPYITQPTPLKTHDRRSYLGNQFRDSLSIKSHSYVELLEPDQDDSVHEDNTVLAMSDTTPDYTTPIKPHPPADQSMYIPSRIMDSIDEDDTPKVQQPRKQAPNPLVFSNSRIASLKGKANNGSRVSQLLAVPSPGSSPSSIDSPQTSRLFLTRAPSARSTGRSSVRSMQWVGFDPSTRYSTAGAQPNHLVVKNARDSVISSDASDSGKSFPPQLPLRHSFGEEFKVTWPTED
ncbi:hypothetical protein Unana1_01195 [Umbelopsis nana]